VRESYNNDNCEGVKHIIVKYHIIPLDPEGPHDSRAELKQDSFNWIEFAQAQSEEFYRLNSRFPTKFHPPRFFENLFGSVQ